MQNLTILALAVPEIGLSLGGRFLKIKVSHVTLTTPLLRVICHYYAGT